MYKGNSSRVVPILIVLVVIAIAIAALVAIGRAVFSGTTTPGTEQVNTSQSALLNTAVSHSVRMTVRGPIVADENFRSYQVTISPTERVLSTFSGYLDAVLDTQTLANNTAAYAQFVYALDKAALTSGTPLTGEADDIRGVCATGQVYEFDVLTDNKSVQHLWTSTCKGSKGSFRASVSQVQSLFLTQMPDSKAVLRKIDL